MKKPSMIKRFFSFLLKVVVVVLLMLCIGVGSFEGVTYYLTGSLYDFREKAQEADNTGDTDTQTESVTETKNEDMENTLLFVDSEDNMSEYIFLSMLNKKTKALDVILFPENPQVQVSRDLLKKISEKLDGKSNTVEFCDIERVFGEEKYDILCEIVGEMLNIEVSGWDHMTAKNATSFLNMISPVETTMKDTISYRNGKGTLKVLEEGDVSLDGETAASYLAYLDGTTLQESNRLDRMVNYLEEYLDRLISEKKSTTIMEKYQKCTESSEDRSFEDMTDALKTSDVDFITLRILQGSESGDFFVIDNQKVQLQISALIKQAASYSKDGEEDTTEEDSDEDTDPIYEGESDSKDLSIELYNAAYVRGIASEWEYFLEDEGYNITIVDTYQQEGPISTTRIILEKEGIGEDLLKYFPNADVSVGDISTGGDIQVYIGTDSTTVGVSE